MKKGLKFLGMLVLATVVFASCSDDNDPADDNLFVGTYNGSVSYSDPDSNTNISTDEGRVTVVKVGDSYNFDFSDGIPSLTGINIQDNENTFISTDGAISIDEGKLIIDYTSGGETWRANSTR